ncbi:MAG: SCO family protein [Deltaproteobacteria bacterium]|nr:SCO family protein [Deltaproteobacteria bacterium]
MPVPGRKLLLGMVAIIVIAIIPVALVLARRPHDPNLEDLGMVTPFELVDDRGQPITQDVFRGHPTVVSFLFTRCDTICPVTTMKMARIQEKTFDKADQIKLVSISVDPTYDTPERLAEYAKHYNADPTRWRFITGDHDTIYRLVEGPFMSSMMREPDKANGVPNIAHGGYFILVDGNLHLRGTYDSGDIHRLDELIRDARYLARKGT